MDQIFYVNSASFVDVSITSSLKADVGSNIDFSQATQVSGSFVGSLFGNATTATSASHSSVTQTAISASHADSSISSSVALSATTASYVINQRIKSGIVSGSQFSGNPQTYTVTFITAFPSNQYSVAITGESSRAWIVQTPTSGGFVLSANTKTAVTGFVFWQAIAVGEFNS